ncbi:UDP-2,4-diacetamido-2,4,6-trideoxy-beta-L-altropyranose hydrolase [Acetobacterium bakii]|uniref:Glycosyl transferase family 28 C-terminal domain-containing protein n=1 Tax=Acetobacterium bakii TaxID=52689 RepID=A0A0L6U2B8_9FIRM|nr:UDP-2,4-diacetamido-2,4,6-trideoxy-beta-L-altropyranose hydrolase [Acetobacterium bakii]KNZ42663.1 hypothetical protein AKG39_05865 [Acetobacterium bakii]
MLGIRVDANADIATGHIMRCLSIAYGMRNIGLDCLFIVADENGKEILVPYGFEIICLNSQWNQLDQETKQLVEVIHKLKIDKLIIDSYYVTAQYLKELEAVIKVIYIDDVNLFQYPISMVINYDIFLNKASYSKSYKGSSTHLLLGNNYVPLREEFMGLLPQYREKVGRVLITTGGTDHFNVVGNLLNRIIKEGLFNDIEFHVIVGIMNKNYEHLKNLAEVGNSFILHKNIKRMAKLMSSCDIAITAGGTTIYELCACGVPTISFSFADNQLCGVKGFAKEGIMSYAGDVRYIGDQCITNLIDYLEEYINRADIRKEKSISMRKKVDGNGVKRIVKYINDL